MSKIVLKRVLVMIIVMKIPQNLICFVRNLKENMKVIVIVMNKIDYNKKGYIFLKYSISKT